MKTKVYFPIWEETNVREAFVKLHESLGFPKIIKSADKSSPTFPDYLLEDSNGNIVRAEAKNYSSNAMGLEGKIDLVICWVHDWTECPASIKVLDLSEHVDDPSTFFRSLAIDVVGFLKKKDPSIEVATEEYPPYDTRYFNLSKKFDQQQIYVMVAYRISDGLGYYSCGSLMPDWLLQKFDLKDWERILETLQDKGFTVRRTVEGFGTSEKISMIEISRRHKAKDLMDDPTATMEILSSDVISVFNLIETSLKGRE